MTLQANGYLQIRNFVNDKLIASLNNELDEIFKSPTINGSYGYIRFGKNIKAVPFPFIYIKSLNLMEMVIDIADRLNAESNSDNEYELRELSIFSEHGDENILPWHTDKNPGALLVLCYLRGGAAKSGGSLFMRGTHIETYGPLHQLSESDISRYSDSLVDLSGQPGDVNIYYVNGFHSRHPVIEERRVIRIWFNQKNNPNVKKMDYDDFGIPVSLLTTRVLKALPTLFRVHDNLPKFGDSYVGTSTSAWNPVYVGSGDLFRHFWQHAKQKLISVVKQLFRA